MQLCELRWLPAYYTDLWHLKWILRWYTQDRQKRSPSSPKSSWSHDRFYRKQIQMACKRCLSGWWTYWSFHRSKMSKFRTLGLFRRWFQCLVWELAKISTRNCNIGVLTELWRSILRFGPKTCYNVCLRSRICSWRKLRLDWRYWRSNG